MRMQSDWRSHATASKHCGQRLDAYARERLTEADFVPILKVDAEVEWDEIGPKLFHGISQLEPFGMGNPQPVLVTGMPGFYCLRKRSRTST